MCFRLLSLFSLLAFLSGCALRKSDPDKPLFRVFDAGVWLTPHALETIIWILIAVALLLGAGLVFKRSRRARQRKPDLHFVDWLGSLDPARDADLAELQTYSKNVKWDQQRDDSLAHLRSILENDTAPTPAEKLRRASALGRYHAQWQREAQETGRSTLAQILYDVRNNGLTLFLSTFALVVVLLIFAGITNQSFFNSLSQVDQARGLITFMVAITAVAVIILTAINIFLPGDGKITFDERSRAAKDLVTIVMGVLGTILGFYFGSFSGDRGLTLSIDTPSLSTSIEPGAKFELKAIARGGSTPYHFDVVVLDAAGTPLAVGDLQNKQTDGAIREQITVPSTTTPGKHSVIVVLRDSKGSIVRAHSDLTVKAPQPASQAPPITAPPPSGGKK